MKPGPEATRAAVIVIGALALAGAGVGYFTHTMAAGPVVHDPITLGTARLSPPRRSGWLPTAAISSGTG
ncbi:MAG: hypothetical protein ABFC38_10335 [Methanospirillum sp.]